MRCWLLLVLCLIWIGNLYNQACPSYTDTRFNPVLVDEMRSTLELSEINECYSGNEIDTRYDRLFLLGTYYTNIDIDSAEHYYRKLLSLSIEHQVDKDLLAFSFFLNGVIALKKNESDLSELFFEGAQYHSNSIVLKTISALYFDAALGKNLRHYQQKTVFEKGQKDLIPLDDYYTLSLDLLIINTRNLEYFKEAYSRSDLVKNDYLRTRILMGYVKELILQEGVDPKIVERKIKESYAKYEKDNTELEIRMLLTDVRIESLKRNYSKSNEIARQIIALRNIDVEKLTANGLRIKSQSLDEQIIFSYTRSLLFLTREGKGLESVKEAYEIYIRLLENRYGEITSSFTHLKSSSRRGIILDNILVIARYLTSETGDLNYISRAWSALNAVNSSTLHWNIRSNQWFRQDDEKGELIESIRDLEKTLFIMTEAWRRDYSNEKFNELLLAYDSYYSFGNNIVEELNLEAGDSFVELTNSINTIRDYVLTDSTTILLFNTSAHKRCLLINKDTIISKNLAHLLRNDTIVDGYLQYLSNPELAAINKNGYAIYISFLKDLVPYLNQHIAIISSDEFESFPFAVLPTDSTENPGYLGDNHTFTYHHTLRTFQHDQQENQMSKQEGLLAMAPKFNTTVQYASRRTTDGTEDLFLTPLRYNTQEVDYLKNNYSGSFYFGANANKATFLEEAPQHQVIHLATHAVADVGDGEQSALFLGYPDRDGLLEAQSLKAGEINNLFIDADMVALSACETGLGTQLLNEGTVGLTRAFISAGARSILSTLWAVDDRATSEIVLDFYVQLEKGKKKSLALATAQQNFRTKYAGSERAHPYYWAPFIIVGNDAPLLGLEASSSSWIGLLALCFGVVLALGFFFYRFKAN